MINSLDDFIFITGKATEGIRRPVWRTSPVCSAWREGIQVNTGLVTTHYTHEFHISTCNYRRHTYFFLPFPYCLMLLFPYSLSLPTLLVPFLRHYPLPSYSCSFYSFLILFLPTLFFSFPFVTLLFPLPSDLPPCSIPCLLPLFFAPFLHFPSLMYSTAPANLLSFSFPSSLLPPLTFSLPLLPPFSLSLFLLHSFTDRLS